MRLVTHLLRGDIRAFRKTLVAWTALAIIVAIVEAAHPLAPQYGALATWLHMTFLLLSVIRALLFAGIIAAVVQTHALVGTTSFWFARPLPPRALFAAKFLLLFVVLVAIPAALEVITMLWYRVPVTQMMQVALQECLVGILVLMPLMCVAALTLNLTQFSLACLGASVASVVAYGLWKTVTFRPSTVPAGLDPTVGGGPVLTSARFIDWTPEVVAALLLIAAATVLLGEQYSHRSVRRALARGAVGLAVAGLVVWLWPWRILSPRQSIPEWALDRDSAQISANPDALWFSPNNAAEGERWRVALAETHVTHMPPSWLAYATLQEASLDASGAPKVSSLGHPYSAALMSPGEADGALGNVLQRVLGVSQNPGRYSAASERAVLIVAKQPELDALSGKPVHYRGVFRIDLTDVTELAVLPINGGTFQDQDFHLAFERPAPGAPAFGLTLDARIGRTHTMFDRRFPRAYLYFVRNRTARQAIEGFVSTARDPDPFRGFPSPWLWAGYSVRPASLQFNVPRDKDHPRQADESWLANAELVIVRATAVGSVVRQLEMNDVMIATGKTPDTK
jgi:hypothetical protein